MILLARLAVMGYVVDMENETYKIIKDALRKSHFESGGSVESWRGKCNVYKDKKKHENKNACRNNYHATNAD